eukprot:sb/3476597/
MLNVPVRSLGRNPSRISSGIILCDYQRVQNFYTYTKRRIINILSALSFSLFSLSFSLSHSLSLSHFRNALIWKPSMSKICLAPRPHLIRSENQMGSGAAIQFKMGLNLNRLFKKS